MLRFVFFFKQKTAYEMRISDWSSDVCSSDLRMLDANYHRALFAHAGNRYLADCYAGFAFRIQALRARLCSDPALNARSLADHRRLRDLIAADDDRAAHDLLVEPLGRRSEEHQSELQSLMRISYDVFCLK